MQQQHLDLMQAVLPYCFATFIVDGRVVVNSCHVDDRYRVSRMEGFSHMSHPPVMVRVPIYALAKALEEDQQEEQPTPPRRA